MKNINKIISIAMCVLLFLTIAIRQENKIWGYPLGEEEVEEVFVDNDTISKLPDGTFVINTAPISKNIVGYRGRLPLKIYLKDGVVQKVETYDNKETPRFYERAAVVLEAWNGKSVDEALEMDVETVSGATVTSSAIIKGAKRGFKYYQSSHAATSDKVDFDLGLKDICVLLTILLAVVVPFFFKNSWMRIAQLVLNVVVLGLWSGTFLSYSAVVSFFSNGVHSLVSGIILLLFIIAFLLPALGKKGYYCLQVCPFGSAQELVSKIPVRKIGISQKISKYLTLFQNLLWIVLMLFSLTGIYSEWMDYEIFTAFMFQSAALPVMIVAVLFLVISIFIPRFFCRFVCPMGAIVKINEKFCHS